MKKYACLCFGLGLSAIGMAQGTNASAQVSAQVTLNAAIEMIITDPNNAYGEYFNTASEFNNGKSLGTNTWTINSNRSVTVQATLSPIQGVGIVGSSPSMSRDRFSYKLQFRNPGQAFQTRAETQIDAAGNFMPGGAPLVNLNRGASSQFVLEMFAKPGWDYKKGIYVGSISITASQP